MKSIATQHGDSGQTRLIGGAQVSKCDLRVEAYGAIDELGAAMGFARSISGDEEINQLTKEIQRELFLVAGSVANPRALQKQPPDVTPAMAERLTREVHRLESLEGILSDWALPGDHTPAAAYDLARSVCRRAERGVVRLRETGEEVSDEVLLYLNRLSDLLWLFGRTLELRAGVDSRLRGEARGGESVFEGMVMLRKLMELIQPERRAHRVCEACGNPFRCGASLKGCWCFQVKLRSGAREELRGKYKYCLCSECLAPFAINHAPDSDRSGGPLND